MFKLIGFLFSGCWHKWKIIDTEIVRIDDGWDGWGTKLGPRHTLQCEHCGKIKAKLAK